MHVYIAGPYSKGDTIENIRRAIIVANDLIEVGHTPYVPHLSGFQHLVMARPYEDWLKIDLAWVARCDAMLRLAGGSPGADREVAEAKRLGIPVVESVGELDDLPATRRPADVARQALEQQDGQHERLARLEDWQIDVGGTVAWLRRRLEELVAHRDVKPDNVPEPPHHTGPHPCDGEHSAPFCGDSRCYRLRGRALGPVQYVPPGERPCSRCEQVGLGNDNAGVCPGCRAEVERLKDVVGEEFRGQLHGEDLPS